MSALHKPRPVPVRSGSGTGRSQHKRYYARPRPQRPAPGVMALTCGYADVIRTLLKLACELVTNVIRHGNGEIKVYMSHACGDLRVEVHEYGAGGPLRRQPSAEDESGRGLALLDGLIGLYGGRHGIVIDGTGDGKALYLVIFPTAGPGRCSGTGSSASCAPGLHRHRAGKPPWARHAR
jgi:hypothetical protein